MKGFYELLSWVSTKALVDKQCFIFNTQSNRVAIVSSVIARIFLNLCNAGRSLSTCFNKNTRDLFMLCIMLVASYRVLFYYCCSFILLFVYRLSCCSFIRLLFIFCSTFVSFDSLVRFNFHCSLFMRKIFNSDPGLYSSVPDEDGWCCWCRLCKYCNLICGVWKGGRTSKGWAVVNRPGARVDGYSHHEQRSQFSM